MLFYSRLPERPVANNKQLLETHSLPHGALGLSKANTGTPAIPVKNCRVPFAMARRRRFSVIKTAFIRRLPLLF
jgi:hypothetical protein